MLTCFKQVKILIYNYNFFKFKILMITNKFKIMTNFYFYILKSKLNYTKQKKIY